MAGFCLLSLANLKYIAVENNNQSELMAKRMKNISSVSIILVVLSSFLLLGAFPWLQEKTREPLSEHSKLWLEEVVPYIITPAEKEIFLNLPNEIERGKFIENFWKKRDPNPETPENEFKLAYYRRIAFANKFFGYGGIPGWKTDRGRVFILLGPPNEIQHDYSYGRGSLTHQGAIKEDWTYWNLPNPNLPYTLEFVFIDAYGTGDYKLEISLGYKGNEVFPLNLQATHLFFNQLEILAEALSNPFEKADRLRAIITTQVNYNLVPFTCETLIRKGSAENNQIIILISLPLDSLEKKVRGNQTGYSITVMLNISNSLGEKILEKTQDYTWPSEIKGASWPLASPSSWPMIIHLPPGEYGFHLLVLDNWSGKIGTFHQKITSPDFKTGKLAMSDLFLMSSAAKEANLLSLKYLKNVFSQNEELTLEFEVYNIQLNPETRKGKLQVKLSFFKDNNLFISLSPLEHEISDLTESQIRTSFRLRHFQPGHYKLRVDVDDNFGLSSCFKEKEFIITSN
ncbi:MAG: GWxTD domain-containing protein [Candidatus Aminicenantes bacterium]|nr:GWxTD domain-containing protein [Candidatus Aminicenantes bacterium]